MERIDGKVYWITAEGDLIKYEQMSEKYAINLLKYLEKVGRHIPQLLRDRSEERRKECRSRWSPYH